MWELEHRKAAAAELLQSFLTLCDPTDGSLLGSPIPGILQARTLEWVAISFSNAWKRKAKVKSLSRARLLATPWAAAYQAPPSMGFSRQECWSGVPLPSLIGRLSVEELVCSDCGGGGLLRVPWTAKRSNQSILKKINTEYSLERLLLKFQYIGYLMWRADSLEKALMLGRIEWKIRRG